MNRLASALAVSFLATLVPQVAWSQPDALPLDVAPMPEHWVPFSAEIDIVLPTGTRWVGRFIRGADGSTRSEIGASLDQIDGGFLINNTNDLARGFQQ